MVTASAPLNLVSELSTQYASEDVFSKLPPPCPRCGRLGTTPATAIRCRIAPTPPPSLVKRHLAAGEPLVLPEGESSRCYRAAKRWGDLIGALALLAILAPVMLAVFVILLVTTRGKPFFAQRRAGYLGRPFTMLKFRTMRPNAEQLKHRIQNERKGPIFKNRSDPRVTRFGRLLRKTSLDETPQLFNVLWGQMSLVGPRPLVLGEVAQMKAWQRRRLAVMPGLTCLWHVSGRSEVAFEDWMRMDVWYVQHQSLWNDLRLLLHTPRSVLSGRGAY
jgi:lipopolysaccharide/colanic/teichoic acid biosynthesis glycosyltransferase